MNKNALKDSESRKLPELKLIMRELPEKPES